MSRRSKQISPAKHDWEDLSTEFVKAADGCPDQMAHAAKAANTFDNRFGTDFIGMLAQAVHRKPKYVRDGKFTNSERTYDRAIRIFTSLSESFPKSAANELARECRIQPETTRHSTFRPPVARQSQRRQTFSTQRAG